MNSLLPIVVGLMGVTIVRVFWIREDRPRGKVRPVITALAVVLSLLTLYLAQLASQISAVLNTDSTTDPAGRSRIAQVEATRTPSPFATHSALITAGQEILPSTTPVTTNSSSAPAKATLKPGVSARASKPQARAASVSPTTSRATAATSTGGARPPAALGAMEEMEEIVEPIPTQFPTTSSPATRATRGDMEVQVSPTRTRSAVQPGPSATTTASPTRPADDVYEQLIAAKDDLQSGKLEATLNYSDGSCSVVTAHFDFGSRTRPPALHRTTIHTSSKGKQMYERITIGDQTWERKLGSKWIEVATSEGVRELIEALLPTTEANQQTVVSGDEEVVLVYWYDLQREVSVTVDVQRVTGMPLAFHEWNDLTNMVVKYKDWNRPVTIKPPSDK